MFSFARRRYPVRLTNTLSGGKELFTPQKSHVSIYSCGPTVYGPQHIGNLRAIIFSDTLARVLESAGYRTKRVVNITDVGHVVGDGDEGEDKMSVGAKRDGTTPKEIADRYSRQYLHDIQVLNVDLHAIRFPRATHYIPDQIAMIGELEKRGHTYQASDGIYFDTHTFPEYGKLGKRQEAKLIAGARVQMSEGKKDSRDFVLWRNAKPGDVQKWKSPWGEGNPGWSIECSAMIRTLLGKTIDIHTGGEDHISIHHNNEIAQSEGVTGQPLARFWLHNAFLTIDGQKISKSLGNVYVLEDVISRGFHPLSLRYFLLQAHYRTPLSFTWEALEASSLALSSLWRMSVQIKKESKGKSVPSPTQKELGMLAADDLNTPQVLGMLWSALQNPALSAKQKWGVVRCAEGILGLSLLTPPKEALPFEADSLPEDLRALVEEREKARASRDFAKADELRIHLENRGYRVDDTPSGPLFTKIRK